MATMKETALTVRSILQLFGYARIQCGSLTGKTDMQNLNCLLAIHQLFTYIVIMSLVPSWIFKYPNTVNYNNFMYLIFIEVAN